jgi:hypothetical protein
MIASGTFNEIALRIFAASSQQTQNAAFALETTKRALEIFESEFSYAFQYGADKLDQVALPFNRCSEVNYGLTFYRENCLLYEPLVSVAKCPCPFNELSQQGSLLCGFVTGGSLSFNERMRSVRGMSEGVFDVRESINLQLLMRRRRRKGGILHTHTPAS